ncbi:unnamed protein product [Ectocarpus sp. 13 AM-2016]
MWFTVQLCSILFFCVQCTNFTCVKVRNRSFDGGVGFDMIIFRRGCGMEAGRRGGIQPNWNTIDTNCSQDFVLLECCRRYRLLCYSLSGGRRERGPHPASISGHQYMCVKCLMLVL